MRNRESGINFNTREHSDFLKEYIEKQVHEAKTVLAVILGYSKLLERGNVSAEQVTEYASCISRQVLRAESLLFRIYNFDEIQENEKFFNFRAFDVSSLINETVSGLAVHTEKHQFIIETPEYTPPVKADKEKIIQVLQNLGLNAIKYSPEGGEIKFTAAVSQNMVCFAVSDNGLGISSQDQMKIFEKGYRIKDTERSNIPGRGLGLAIVEEIVRIHNGRIWVESEINKGSTFYFTLPAATDTDNH